MSQVHRDCAALRKTCGYEDLLLRLVSGSGGIVLMHSGLDEPLMTAQQTLFVNEQKTEHAKLSVREAGELVRRKVISPPVLQSRSAHRSDTVACDLQSWPKPFAT